MRLHCLQVNLEEKKKKKKIFQYFYSEVMVLDIDMTDHLIFAFPFIFIGDFGAKQFSTIPTRPKY